MMRKLHDLLRLKIIVSGLIITSVAVSLLSACQTNKDSKSDTEKYESNWESLSEYECPEWFRDAKFGIWAVNSPMEVAEFGDWYALKMYQEGSDAYNYHCEKYGHPSEFGYKDLIPLWTLEHLNTDTMAALFAKAGAKYLVTLASHHDGFDTYDSKYQPWNAVNMGPKFDLLGSWAKSARANDLKFGATVHAINSWGWNRNAFLSDTAGQFKGVPYDGNQTKEDGKGLWWEGYDPQDLYGPIEKESDTFPTLDYINNWYNRQVQLLDDYKPDLLYYDAYIMKPVWRQFVYFGDQTYEGVTPMFKSIAERTPYKEAGIDVLSYYYNQSKKWSGKDDQLVFNLKVHDLGNHVPEKYKKGMVIDRELGGFGGAEKEMQKYPWQKDSPFGDWQYNPDIVYPETKEIIWSLVDIVSKNGNLLLGMPMRPDGTYDDRQYKFFDEMGKWISINGKGIYESRPYDYYGEGTVRYTRKGETIYAFVNTEMLDDNVVSLKLPNTNISMIKQLGVNDKVKWESVGKEIQVKPQASNSSVIAFEIEQYK